MTDQATAAIRLPEHVTVGDRVRIARQAIGLTRKEMAKKAGISLKTLQRVEHNQRELQLSELNALITITGQDAFFFGASDVSGSPNLQQPPVPVNR